MREKLFLLSSKVAARRLTEIFDFVWPTAAAIWNLRWQVQGYVANVPDVSDEELLGRFVSGSGIRGANLRRSCTKTTWDEQKQEFARFLLIEFCALYEAWCEGALVELGQPASFSKYLQYPTSNRGGKGGRGVGKAISDITGAPSSVISGSFYPVLIKNKKHSLIYLESLMACYRYFKELRNSLVHSGNGVSVKLLDAEKVYGGLSASVLGVKEKPEAIPQMVGSGTAVSLRGVVGFGDVVLKLICTLDAELSCSLDAEQTFISRWKSLHGSSPIVIANKASARIERIKRLVRKLGLPTPVDVDGLDVWLTSKRLITA